MARYTVETPKGPKRKAIYGKSRQEVAAKLAKAIADRDGGVAFDAENRLEGAPDSGHSARLCPLGHA